MGELHLDIYLERMRREFNCDTIVGKPMVAFKEVASQPAKFDFIHKKQTGGRGQFAHIIGTIEPVGPEEYGTNEFSNAVIGGTVPVCYIPAIEKVCAC